MWCTRWYLPLLLLPIPIAPPYFLFLFLFSTTMHARPCFYCIVLLIAMFMSTCYWPPVPIDTPLAQPWSEHVTTFADALHAIMPNISEEKVPATIPVADRCWCDLSNGFFAPFNTTQWEELSVVRLKEKLEMEIAAEQRAKEKEECETSEREEGAEASGCNVPETEGPKEKETSVSPLEEMWGTRTPLEMLWDGILAFRRRSTRPEPTPAPSPATENPGPDAVLKLKKSVVSNSTNRTPEQVHTSSSLHPSTPSSWFRREYDLRRFGFAMVLDFGWPNYHS